MNELHHTQAVIGIDLGTTNSALAYWQPAPGADSLYDKTPVQVLPVPQLVGPGEVQGRSSLPSFLYLPHQNELSATGGGGPWEAADATRAVAGVWARERGALVPNRLIASAKSWLCSGAIDRRAALLPWKSDVEVGKCSPVQASSHYLRHLIGAYRSQHDGEATAPHVVLTVPASFDEVARTLTYEAASAAGIDSPTLLEEPLAAFYAWLDLHAQTWRQVIGPGDLILVCDVGGGTCDFSMIAVTEEQGKLQLERISVGDHLLLGGDNMDLALAHTLKRQLEQDGKKLDHWQFLSLVSAARAAKERLLSEEDLAAVPISVASRSASLFASTLSTELTQDQVRTLLVEGFIPLTRIDEMPLARRSAGFQEMGLNYESDPAISRHLARFLRRSWQNVHGHAKLRALVGERLHADQEYLLPSAVLFNGGVFNAPILRERILSLLASWDASGAQVKELSGSDCELAVARGAAYYGRLRATGAGIRVQSGTARSYYVGLEEPAPAVPGYEPPVKGLCLVPQGTDEGTDIELASQQFGLVVGEPVDFRFFSSNVRASDEAGNLVDDAEAALEESARLSITLPADGHREGEVVPVHIDAAINETGMLQLFMRDISSQQRWQLEFNVRSHEHA